MLTPEQITKFTDLSSADWSDQGVETIDLADTLAVYVSVAQRVAEGNEWVIDSDWGTVCAWCGAEARCVGVRESTHWEADHAPDCLYLEARRLRGME